MPDPPKPESIEAIIVAYLADDGRDAPPPTRRERSFTPPTGSAPYHAGGTARAHGATREDCPYQAAEHRTEARDWFAGWHDANLKIGAAVDGPYLEGFRTRRRGLRLAANPHPVNSLDAGEWERGWHDAG